MVNNIIERRGAYLFDPTAQEAIANLSRTPSHASATTQQLAHQLATEMVPNIHLLTRKQIADIQEERRGRSRMIQSLQERFPGVSGEERKILINRLKDLQLHQSAANIVIKRFHRGR